MEAALATLGWFLALAGKGYRYLTETHDDVIRRINFHKWIFISGDGNNHVVDV